MTHGDLVDWQGAGGLDLGTTTGATPEAPVVTGSVTADSVTAGSFVAGLITATAESVEAAPGGSIELRLE